MILIFLIKNQRSAKQGSRIVQQLTLTEFEDQKRRNTASEVENLSRSLEFNVHMKTKGRTNFVYKKWEEFYGVTLEDKFLQIDSDL